MTAMQTVLIIIEFEYRSDSGPQFVGPFVTRSAAVRHVEQLKLPDAVWNTSELTPPSKDIPNR